MFASRAFQRANPLFPLFPLSALQNPHQALRQRSDLWLALLLGKCRNCSFPISPMYPVIEFLTGLLFIDLLHFRNHSSYLQVAVLCCLMIILIVTDLRVRLLPDAVVWPGFGIGSSARHARSPHDGSSAFALSIRFTFSTLCRSHSPQPFFGVLDALLGAALGSFPLGPPLSSTRSSQARRHGHGRRQNDGHGGRLPRRYWNISDYPHRHVHRLHPRPRFHSRLLSPAGNGPGSTRPSSRPGARELPPLGHRLSVPNTSRHFPRHCRTHRRLRSPTLHLVPPLTPQAFANELAQHSILASTGVPHSRLLRVGIFLSFLSFSITSVLLSL